MKRIQIFSDKNEGNFPKRKTPWWDSVDNHRRSAASCSLLARSFPRPSFACDTQ